MQFRRKQHNLGRKNYWLNSSKKGYFVLKKKTKVIPIFFREYLKHAMKIPEKLIGSENIRDKYFDTAIIDRRESPVRSYLEGQVEIELLLGSLFRFFGEPFLFLQPLEVILESHVQVEGVRPVCEADPEEGSSTVALNTDHKISAENNN